MLYKRPNFKMGGSPTGIETLEPRKKFMFGTPGFSFLEPGLQRELRSNFLNRPDRFRFTQSAGVNNPLLRGGLMALPFAPTAAMAYLNRPKTTEALKVMKSEPSSTFDETGLFEYEDFVKKMDKANKEGEEISFLDAFLLDPEKGTYPKFAGRTEDRDRKIKSEIEEKEKEKRREAFDRPTMAEIAGKVIPEKKDPPPNIIINDTKTGGETVEDSFEADFNRMQKRITKFLKDNKQETKGKVAIALSNAVGTPGTLADKAAVLNNALLGIASAKKKDEKDIAKLAFAAATELEGKRIDAGKLSQRQKDINRLKVLENKDNLSKEEQTELRALQGVLRVGDKKLSPSGGKTYSQLIGNIKNRLRQFNDETISDEDKLRIRDEIKSVISGLNEAGFEDETILAQLTDYPFAKQFFNKGGRVNMAMGGATETPAEPVATNLTFEQLRTRLPKEITDDIVQLVATSEEALQDFAYIRTQGDVEKFNVKYGVNLVLPQNTV